MIKRNRLTTITQTNERNDRNIKPEKKQSPTKNKKAHQSPSPSSFQVCEGRGLIQTCVTITFNWVRATPKKPKKRLAKLFKLVPD
jgi:hypothetical protein